MSGIFGGSYGGRYDQELQAKIDAALSGKASTKDKIEDFVKSELKMDPATMRLTVKTATTLVGEMLSKRSKQTVAFRGNSLGLKSVLFLDAPDEQDVVCPLCGDYVEHYQDNDYICYSCLDPAGKTDYYRFTNVQAISATEDDPGITVNDHDKDWPDFLRIHDALMRGMSDVDTLKAYSWTFTASYRGDPEVTTNITVCDPKVKNLKTGDTARLHRSVIDGEDEYVYVKKGGLFDDTTLVILDTMKPITDLSGYRVIEIL